MLDVRLWQMAKIATVLLLIMASAVLTNTFRFRRDKKRFQQALAQERNELQQTKSQLQQTVHRLAVAEKKLGFLNQHKTPVHVTAFTGVGTFANGGNTQHSYAVPTHRLPEGKILNIALSPTAQRNLNARLNDYIVLLDSHGQNTRLARFVDTTAADEVRSVVDVFFANPAEARVFGRQHFLAVNISGPNSPFREQ